MFFLIIWKLAIQVQQIFFASKQLAEKGYKVLTFIYEPFRDFYHGHNMEAKNQILENSLEKS